MITSVDNKAIKNKLTMSNGYVYYRYHYLWDLRIVAEYFSSPYISSKAVSNKYEAQPSFVIFCNKLVNVRYWILLKFDEKSDCIFEFLTTFFTQSPKIRKKYANVDNIFLKTYKRTRKVKWLHDIPTSSSGLKKMKIYFCEVIFTFFYWSLQWISDIFQ